jgi:kynurenine 3-monooxygenase
MLQGGSRSHYRVRWGPELLLLFLVAFPVSFSLSPTLGASKVGGHPARRSRTTQLFAAPSSSSIDPPVLNVAIVGVGPSGLLLAHLLLKQQNNNIKVHLFERRSDPRKQKTDQRAYALGLGIRGRTAIRTVDDALWEAVKKSGFESERFQLHIGKLVIRLRSEEKANSKTSVEPSVLLYRTALCAALTEELERRYGLSSSNLKVSFDQMIDTCDLESMNIISTSNNDDGDGGGSTTTTFGPFDLIVGTDGVNSVVRKAIQSTWPAFQADLNRLPGEFKVVQLEQTPPNVDPLSVSLILPKSGSATAFVEPTGADGSCCVLFAGKADSPILTSTTNATFLKESLLSAFPQWAEGPTMDVATEQLMAQKMAGSASSVLCNTYHYSSKAVLTGDAAHATGGVSGQGVNSALIDSVVLAECIAHHRDSLATALLEYSKRQVPEGKALFDLSFGPKPTGFKAIQSLFITARDTLFKGRWGIGRPPLQTRLTTELTSFAELRREKQRFYPEPFPEDSQFQERLEKLHAGDSISQVEV